MNIIKYIFIGNVLVSATLNILSADTQTSDINVNSYINTIYLDLNDIIHILKPTERAKDESQIVADAIKRGQLPPTHKIKCHTVSTNGLNLFCSLLAKSPKNKPNTIIFECSKFNDISLSPFTQALTQHAHSLTELSFDTCRVEQNHIDAFAQIVALCCCLKMLSFRSSYLGDYSIKPLTDSLAQNSSITELNLADNRLQGANIKELGNTLSKNVTLKSLTLLNNAIEDTAFHYLAEGVTLNTSLESLNLTMNKITMQGINDNLTIFEKNSSLKTLSMYNNRFGESDVSTLGEAIAKNKSLTRLDLGVCNISEESIQMLKAKAPDIKISVW